MKLSEWSVRNSLLVNLVTVFLMLAGIMALFNIRREVFPNVAYDVVQIATTYPGATPSQIETLITTPLEKELKEIDDIKDFVSVSEEGFSLIYLVFETDAENPDKLFNDVQKAVDRVDDLPDDLKDKPLVEELSTKLEPLIEISLSGQLSPETLRQQARLLETALLEVSEVGRITRRGYREREIWVEVDPAQLAHYHVAAAEVFDALKRTNVNVPGGTIEEGDTESLLRVSGEFFKIKEIENIIIRSNDQGHFVKVKDVARVVPTLEEPIITNRTDGTEAINLKILKRQKGDVIILVREVKRVVEEFKKNAPAGLKVAYLNDLSFYVKRRLHVLINNGLIGLGLLMVPLVLFLSRRTALSAAMGLLTVIVTVFAAMYFFGITINLMSLFGMIMVLGMLVDEDIVIAENVHRLIEEGKPPREAAIEGSRQVSKSVVATVLTTITAFIPLLMMTGIVGRYVRLIPVIVIIALTASLLQALVILPSHIADLHKMSEDKLKKLYIKSKASSLMQKSLDVYEKVVRIAIRYRYLMLLSFILLLVGAALTKYWKVPYINFPRKGIEQFFVRVEGKVGTPVLVTTERMKAIERALDEKLAPNELDNYITQGGIVQNDPSDPFAQRASHVGQVWVFLSPETERNRSVDEIIEELRATLVPMEGMKVYFEKLRFGPPEGKPVAVKIRGDHFDELNEIAKQYMDYLVTLEGVKDIKSDFETGKPELIAVIDEEKMTQAGLKTADVAAAVRLSYDGGVATTIRESDEEIDVVVKFSESLRNQKDSLDKIMIPNLQGRLVPLNKIATFEERTSVSLIKHDKRKRRITITADVDEKIITSNQVNNKLAKHFRDITKEKPGITIEYGGEEEDTQESLDSLYRAFILAIFLIFIILAVTFKSLWEPFIILTTIPMGIMGVIFAFAIHGEPLSFLSMLGVVGFAGVVVDSAILMVDFINQEKERGCSFYESIVRGARMRFRPIVLTTSTTVLGVLPAAFGIGGTDPFIQPMARAMNWGIASGGILAVVLIPVFLAISADLVCKFKPSLRENS